MRKDKVIITWTCDACHQEVLPSDLDKIFIEGYHDSSSYCMHNYIGMDICRECQTMPVLELLAMLKRRKRGESMISTS